MAKIEGLPLVFGTGARTSVFLLPRAFSVLLQILTLPVLTTKAEEKAREGEGSQRAHRMTVFRGEHSGMTLNLFTKLVRTSQIGARPVHQMKFLSR